MCVRSLLSSAEVTEIHVDFLPFIPKPVTEYSTVNTSMLNFVKIAKQLDQEALPIFSDEGVFRILVDIYLQSLFQCLVDFMLKDQESREVCDRQKSLVSVFRYCSKSNKL